MKKLLIVTVLFVLVSCGNNNEQIYPCTHLDNLDKDMLDLIESVRNNHSKNVIFLKKFQMEQTAWNQYRNRRIKAMYPKDWDKFYRKSYPTEFLNECKCKESVRLTKNRIEDLKFYLNGGPADQGECPSIQIK